MSKTAAERTILLVLILTMVMMGYVWFKVELLKLSYAIDADDTVLTENQDKLRAVRYEVARMKALKKLEIASGQMDLLMKQPTQVSYVAVKSPLVDINEVIPRTFPQRIFSTFSLVPEALAETEKRTS